MRRYLGYYGPLFLLMGCVGITVEIFFTAIYDMVQATGDSSWALMGQSYVWMFPLYGLTALAFPPIINKFQNLRWWGRGLLAGIGILIIEYIAGSALRYFTGVCPWEYSEGWQVHGVIRLDYYPFWVAFSIGIEAIIRFLHPRVKLTT